MIYNMTILLKKFFGIFHALFTPGTGFQKANHEKWAEKSFFPQFCHQND